MNKELIINVTSREVFIALLENKTLMELHQEKHNNAYTVGDLYLGRVKKLVPGLNAAFVEVGYERDAFLHYFDLGPQASNVQKYCDMVRNRKLNGSSMKDFELEPDIDKGGNIKQVLKPGQDVLIQIAKEPISTKGPRISTELSIAGRYIVLVPFSDRISVSSKIKSRKEKDRLRRLIQSIKPKNFGIILRTNAENMKVAELDKDLRELLQKWDEGFHTLQNAEVPTRILGELDRTNAIIRDVLNDDFNAIYVDDKSYYEEIRSYLKSFAPEKVKMVKLYKNKASIFDYFGLEKQIKASFGKHVTMKSGAYLVIEHTEALHVIDVNSGNTAKKENSQEENALRTNMESAAEIARQLRLRDMGGIVVIDFIDMQKSENKKTLFNKISEEMKKDRAKHYVLPPSKFGLVQITRQRVRPEMEIKTAEVIPTKEGDQQVQATILLVDEIENQVKNLIENQQQSVKSIKVHPFIDAYFKQNRKKYQWKWFFKWKKWIKIHPRTAYPLVQYKIIGPEESQLYP